MYYYSDEDDVEDTGYLRLHNPGGGSGNKCLGGSAPPTCTTSGSTTPPSSAYRKALTDISEGLCRDLTKSAHSYGTMPRLPSNGCHSSVRGCVSTSPSDELTHKLLKLSPDQIATQITLGDFPVFKAIGPEELTTCGWTKKDKHKLAPNVVQLTKRFNHLSFWVVHETLNAGGVKSRAEVMTHFIKVARRLGYLHNYHSQFAVISSLQSAPLYRLRKTWAALSRRDRNHFDRMAELFSEKNNWEKLRAHVDSLKLPMIPYLGLFLTDIVYIDMAHPHFGGLESEQRELKMNNLLRVLAGYQQSDYSRLPRLPRVQQYLASIKYIEELQKFVEDDHYKLSVCLEPNTPMGSHNTSKDSLMAECGGTPASQCAGQTSPVRSNTMGKPPPSCTPHSKFVPGHRKARSLGTNIFKGCSVATTSSSEGSRCDSLSSLGGAIAHDPSCPSHHGSKHLLDDSDLEPPPLPLPPVPPPPSAGLLQHCSSNGVGAAGDHAGPAGVGHANSRMALTRSWSGMSVDSRSGISVSGTGEDCVMQGALRRKTVLKDGRKPSVGAWHRYWVQLWGGALVYYHPKSLASRGLERSDFKSSPCKLQPLSAPGGKLLLFGPHQDGGAQLDMFQLSDQSSDTIYKFRAPSMSAARCWLARLAAALQDGSSTRPPENLMSFE